MILKSFKLNSTISCAFHMNSVREFQAKDFLIENFYAHNIHCLSLSTGSPFSAQRESWVREIHQNFLTLPSFKSWNLHDERVRISILCSYVNVPKGSQINQHLQVISNRYVSMNFMKRIFPTVRHAGDRSKPLYASLAIRLFLMAHLSFFLKNQSLVVWRER